MKIDYEKFSELCAAYVLGSIDEADSDHGVSFTKSGCRLLIIASLSDYYPQKCYTPLSGGV